MTPKIRELEAALQDLAETARIAVEHSALMLPVVEAARARAKALEGLEAGDLRAPRELQKAERMLAEFVSSYNVVIARRS